MLLNLATSCPIQQLPVTDIHIALSRSFTLYLNPPSSIVKSMPFTQHIISFKSVVKGYHIYKLKVPVGTVCQVEIDSDYDEDSVKITEDGHTIGHASATPHPVNKGLAEVLREHPGFGITW